MGILRGIIGTLGELFQFLWSQKRWWLIPMIIVLVLLIGLIILGATTGLGPFIYSFF